MWNHSMLFFSTQSRAKRDEINWIEPCLCMFYKCLPYFSAYVMVFITSHGLTGACVVGGVLVIVKHVYSFFFLFKPATNPFFCFHHARVSICMSKQQNNPLWRHAHFSAEHENMKANTEGTVRGRITTRLETVTDGLRLQTNWKCKNHKLWQKHKKLHWVLSSFFLPLSSFWPSYHTDDNKICNKK